MLGVDRQQTPLPQRVIAVPLGARDISDPTDDDMSGSSEGGPVAKCVM